MDERAGHSRTETPLTMGVPFPRGTIYSDQDVQIAGVPAQFKALSYWQDGSVKWLLCDFQADVSAYGRSTYYLSDGTGSASGTPLTASEDVDSIVVKTGPLKFVVSKTDFNLFQRLWLDLNENGDFEADEEMISPHSQDGAIVTYDSGQHFYSSLDGDITVELEEEGPLRLVILAEGWHRDASGERGLDFTIRIHAYSGQSFVRVHYTFYNRQSTSIGAYWEPPPPPESYVNVQDISLRSHINLQGATSYAFGGDGTVHSGSLSGDQNAYIYAYGTVTPNDLHYLIGGSGSGSGSRARGWADISDSRWGLTTGIRQFWQHHPKGIDVGADGEIWVRIIPEYYPSFPINPDDPWTAADIIYCGAAKTHEVYYFFHPGDHEAANSGDVMCSLENPLYAIAPTEWYCSAEVFGKMPPKDISLIRSEYRWIVQDWEEKVETMFNTIIQNRESSYWSAKNEYGMWNYGDSYQSEWSNMQYDTPYSLFMQFCRNVVLDYFDLAVDQCRHYRDVDIVYHMGDVEPGSLREAFVGSARRLPNNNHALGYDTDFMGDISLKGPGLIYHYFFTGDRQSLYGGKMQADYVRNSALRYQRDYIFCGPRRLGMGMQALMAYYEASGDESYLNNGVYHLGDMDGSLKASAYTLARKTHEHQNISPDHPEEWAIWGSFGCDCDDGLKFQSINYGGCSWQACQAWDALRQYFEITGDTVARDDVLRGVAWMCDPSRTNLWNGQYFYGYDPDYGDWYEGHGKEGAGFNLGPLGFAYEQTGNIDYIDKAISSLDIQINHCGATTDPKWFSQVTKTVPRFFYYLTEEYGVQDTIPPNPPTDLHTTDVKEHSVSMAWTPPPLASDGDGASSYSIFRDSTPIGTSVAAEYEDSGLPENTAFAYAVYSKDNAGNLSLTAATGTFRTLADTVAPVVSNVSITGATGLEVVFSEPVEELSAEEMSNYQINHGVAVLSADLQSDLLTVELITSPHEEGITYTMTINNVRDRAVEPNTIPPNSTYMYEFQLQLVITNINRPGYEDEYLQVGDEYYIDRTYTILNMPEGKGDLLWIKTANDDKMNADEIFLIFDINIDADVYVGYDKRASGLPDWITGSFTNSAQVVEVSDGDASPMQLWVKHCSAGTVTLGGNMAPGASGVSSMYLVFLPAKEAVVDTSGPQISDLAASGITPIGATINWITDELADSQVEYGLSPGDYPWAIFDSLLTTNHQLDLSDLSPNTTYHYRVTSADLFENSTISEDQDFTTAAQDTTPPQISQIQALVITDTTARITWLTDEFSDSQVEYGLDVGYGFISLLDPILTLSHQVVISLPAAAAKFASPPGSRAAQESMAARTGGFRSPRGKGPLPKDSPEEVIYHYRVLSKDIFDNLAISEDDTFVVALEDTTAPQIVNMQIWSVMDTSAQMSWETDKLARATLYYGLQKDDYQWSLEDTTLASSHQFTLQGLAPATTYHLQAWSADVLGNWSVSPDTTLVTKHLLPKQPGKPSHYDD